MIIGIVGSRRRNTQEDYELVLDKFKKLYRNGDTIVSGGCPKGGDRFAKQIAKTLNIPIKIHRAKWELFHKQAGFIRNTSIANDSDILIACIAQDRTGGTEDTIRKYKRLGKLELHLI